MSNPKNENIKHQETADLLEAFQMLCRKCRSGDVDVIVRGFAFVEDVLIKCNGCGNSAVVYTIGGDE